MENHQLGAPQSLGLQLGLQRRQTPLWRRRSREVSKLQLHGQRRQAGRQLLQLGLQRRQTPLWRRRSREVSKLQLHGQRRQAGRQLLQVNKQQPPVHSLRHQACRPPLIRLRKAFQLRMVFQQHRMSHLASILIQLQPRKVSRALLGRCQQPLQQPKGAPARLRGQ
eukprot:Rmarinus@m.21355